MLWHRFLRFHFHSDIMKKRKRTVKNATVDWISQKRTDENGVRPKSVTLFIIEKYSVVYRLRGLRLWSWRETAVPGKTAWLQKFMKCRNENDFYQKSGGKKLWWIIRDIREYRSWITRRGSGRIKRSRKHRSGAVWILSLIHIWRCRRLLTCRSRWSPYH